MCKCPFALIKHIRQSRRLWVVLLAVSILASIVTNKEPHEIMGTAELDTADMIEDCQERESQLSDWEAEFIDSIDSQLRKGSGLTDKQLEKLEQIWDRVTS